MIELKNLRFNEKGLIPVIVQDFQTKDVLMLAYMNEEAISETIETGYATYFSRKRQQLWKKGETSGHYQFVKSIAYDCDQDSILLQVEQIGVACHIGKWSCFNDQIDLTNRLRNRSENELNEMITDLYNTVLNRKENPKVGSYTNYLFEKGIDKILKKIGEEASEVIIGAKNEGNEELIFEICDLVYHLTVLMVEKGVKLEDISNLLKSRRERVGS